MCTAKPPSDIEIACSRAPEPPPVPSPSAFGFSRQVPWRLWVALLAFIPVADVCLYGIPAVGAGLAVAFCWTALLALFVSRAQGRVVLGTAVLVPSLLATIWEPGWANAISLFAGLSILAWTNRASELAWGLLASLGRMATAPAYAVVYAGRTAVSLSKQEKPHTRRMWHLIGLVWPAVLMSGFFLLLLSCGNAVLAQWVSAVADWVGAVLAAIVFPEFLRVLFWIVAGMLGILLLVPAHRCGKKPGRGSFLANCCPDGTDPEKTRLRWMLVLIGVNVVFLLTNTLDAVYLWVRQTPPEGVSTTEYLYGGVYGLIFATLLAGGLLAGIFHGGRTLTRSPWLRGLGLAWVVQNMFLISGVAFRLWLHVDHFCLTPRRVEVAFFLLLVLAGFALLLVYMLREKSLRWLVGSNGLAVITLFWGVQFAEVESWCVTSALEKRKMNTELSIDVDFLGSVGLPGWRLMEMLAKQDSSDPDVARARRCWALLREASAEEAEELPWQAYAGHAVRESHVLCSSLGVPVRDMRALWRQALALAYADERR